MLIKAAKVLASVIIADSFIGLVVPPLNQRLTKMLRNKQKSNNELNNSQDKVEISTNKEALEQKNGTKSPSFKGAIEAINVFTNAIENTNTGKLLSTDVGLTSGRIYSARNNDERREIAFRDIVSIYFYMWAQGHVGNLLNFIESGHATRLNPNTTKELDEHLAKFLKENLEVYITSYEGEILGMDLPDKVELVITHTEPAVKGNTTNNALKDATCETGLLVRVPLFIEQDETIIVSTSDGKYVSRA